MKRICQTLFFASLILTFISCQKSYAPEGVVIGGGGTGTGGGTTSGSQLIKFNVTDPAGTSEYKYEYNSGGQITKVVLTGVVSGQTVIYQWRLLRDNAGKLTGYSTKINIPGYPDSVLYTLHYPTGSANFDYATSSYQMSGATVKDSLIYTVTGGKITQAASFLNYAGTGYMASSKAVYSYDANGNIKEIDAYENTGSSLTRTENYQYEYDDKSNSLQLGLEAFIFNSSYVSKNNYIKEIYTDYSTSTTGQQSTVNYVYQYNSLNKPTSAVATKVGAAGTAQLAYTYQ